MFTGALNRWKERKLSKQQKAKEAVLSIERRLVGLVLELERPLAYKKHTYVINYR